MTDQAADLLLAARRDRVRIAGLPERLRPVDQAAAYAIQRRTAMALGPIGGWKVGAAGPQAAPICGPMPASGITASPARLANATQLMRGIEAEISFRMARDLPPREKPYTRTEVIDAIEAAYPAIELLDSRYIDPDALGPLDALADTQSHGGFIHGAPITDWQGIDFAAETVSQSVDGAPPLQRTGNPAGDMIRLVEWLANTGAVWAGGLRAGQFVTCGSWTGKTIVGPAARVLVTFPSVGDVLLDFSP